MEKMLIDALQSLTAGFTAMTWQSSAMIFLGLVLIYLAIKRGVEPLLLVPIGFGAVLVNLYPDLMGSKGLLHYFYDFGITTEIFPCLIFIGIGAMTDFGPLLENPAILLFGAAGQFGIFMTLLLALQFGFTKLQACSIGIIGACDGPTSIYFSEKYAKELLTAISVAAYSYMSLVPIIQPAIMRLLTTEEERKIKMTTPRRTVSKTVRILFPILVTLVTCLIAPFGTPLMGCLMLGNLLRESGVTGRLLNASQNEIANTVTLLLGISIGGSMIGSGFLNINTLIILGLGLFAIIVDTAAGVLFGKLMKTLTRGRINPLIGAAGISAFPMAARVVQKEGQKANPQSYLLMHAMGANAGGQIGSVLAASVMMSVLNGMKF